MSAEVEVKLATSRPEFQSILDIRRLVFQQEQDLARNSLVDAEEIESQHAIVVAAGQTVSAGRLTPPNAKRPEAVVSWVATRQECRGRGYGGLVMRRLLQFADERGYPVVALTAQTHALSFYEAFGFRAYGKRFSVVGIEHQRMERRKPAQT